MFTCNLHTVLMIGIFTCQIYKDQRKTDTAYFNTPTDMRASEIIHKIVLDKMSSNLFQEANTEVRLSLFSCIDLLVELLNILLNTFSLFIEIIAIKVERRDI